jgi:UDP-glucose 4-epimerase
VTIKKAKVLITGGAGFIGTHLADWLRRDNQVTLFDNFRRNALQYAPELRDDPNVSLLTGDVLNVPDVISASRGQDIIIHLAAIAGVSSYYSQALLTLRVNVLGTVNMLEAASAAGVQQFIDFSTSEVYGADALWVTEDSPHGIGPVTDPRWVYATSKLASEHFTLRFAEAQGFRAVIVRPFNVFGPRQIGEGAISNFCRAVRDGEPLKIYGEGSAIRAWCYVSDMVRAVDAILDRPEAAGQVFNIGNPRNVDTTYGLAKRVANLNGGCPLEYIASERAEVRSRVPDISKARRVLGYEPEVDLDEGLRRTMAWFTEGGIA